MSWEASRRWVARRVQFGGVFPVIELFARLIDPDTDLLDEKFFRAGIVDNHYEISEYAGVLCRALNDIGFDEVVREQAGIR